MSCVISFLRFFGARSRQWAGIVTSFILSVAYAHAAPALDSLPTAVSAQMTLADGRLTAQFVKTPLRQVLEEFSKLSGTRVRWLTSIRDEPVSIAFTYLPFSEALRRILGDKNFLLFYTSTGGENYPTQLWITGRPQGQYRTKPAGDAFSTDNHALLANSSVPPYREETSDTLIETALHDPNLVERISALTQLKEYANEDPRVRTIMEQVAQSDGAPEVQEAASALLADF